MGATQQRLGQLRYRRHRDPRRSRTRPPDPRNGGSGQDAGTPVFANVKDGELTKLGIDEKVLAFARTVTDAAQLDAAKSFLPETQWDVLFGLAAGFTPDEVWADLGAQS